MPARGSATKLNEVFDERQSYILNILKHLDLPSKIADVYINELGIEHLFDWQVECLRDIPEIHGHDAHNFIYSAPTSGGKSLVAELLMLS